MSVKVKLADGREVGGRAAKAGDVVEVAPAEARLLERLGVATRVDDDGKKKGPAAQSAAGDDKPAAADDKAGAARRKG